jgi:DHA2 family multidrug resistance protein-like MFS transporter
VGSRALPANPLSPRRFDTQSACCAWASSACCSIPSTPSATAGWLGGGGCALLTAISLVLLLKLQSASAPMLPLDLLRIPLFALSIGTSFCSFAAQMAVS